MLGAELTRLRSLTGVKWTANDPDVVPSWVADMDFESPPEVTAAMQAILDRGDYGYNMAARDQLITAWGDWQQRHFDWRPPEDECMVFTATLNCMALVLELMTEPGDGVVLFTPIYHPFRDITEDGGRRIVDVPLQGPDWRLDPERFEAAIDPGTKLVMFCNPHNPLGRMFDHDELAAFVEVAQRHDLLVVSDEIWADLTFADGHIPLWRDFEGIRERTVTLASASKTFSIAGLRCAVAHVGDPGVRRRFEALPGHFVAGPNTLGAEASLAAWTHGRPWLDEVKAQLLANRDQLAARVASDLDGVTMHVPEATYLAWLDFGDSALADDPAGQLLERGGVALNAGAKFSPTATSCARLNFATSPEILDMIIDRIAKTLAAS